MQLESHENLLMSGMALRLLWWGWKILGEPADDSLVALMSITSSYCNSCIGCQLALLLQRWLWGQPAVVCISKVLNEAMSCLQFTGVG